jgi:hypothetical protein
MRVRKLKTLSIALFATGLFAAGSVSAVLPDSGWYYNPDESGRGFNIEIQGDTLFIAGFMYDTVGNPIWVFSGGPMSSDTTYSAAAFQTANGQPLGGAYHPATTVPFGTATVTFPTTTTADIVVNGYSFSVERQVFGFDFSSAAQPLLGEFIFVSGDTILPVYFGERISFNGTQVSTTNGTTFAAGNRTGDSGVNNIAVGQFNAGTATWGILLDSSPLYYEYFTFTFEGLNLVEGTSSTYLKGSSPNGSLNTIGHRTKSALAAAGGVGPGVINEMKRPTAALGTDSYAAAKASAQTPNQLAPAQLEALHQLEAVLQGIR